MEEKINRRSRSREKDGSKKRKERKKEREVKIETQKKVTNTRIYVVRLLKLTTDYPVFISFYYIIYFLKTCTYYLYGRQRISEHIEDGAFKLFKCTFPGFNL